MDSVTIYQDIAKRTNGDIYIGVVGPVRSGKSTFIKKFMDELVLPNISDENERVRVTDELPQSATGKAVMTTQPQFVPDKGVRIDLEGNLNVNIRLIDCVGYMVSGVENQDRMVNSPWFAHEIPFAEAGEIGTKKVMCDHSTIGIVVTTDGSVTEFARGDYEQSEERIIADMKRTNKPFIILLNTKNPDSPITEKLVQDMSAKYGVAVVAKDVSGMIVKDIQELLYCILGEFPLRMIGVTLPKWMQMLSFDSELISKVMNALADKTAYLNKMCDYEKLKDIFTADNDFNNVSDINVRFDDGSIAVNIVPKEELFYRVLSDCCGVDVKDESALFGYIKNASRAIKISSKMDKALEAVEQFGYGVVVPNEDEIAYNTPEIEVNGSKKNIKMTADCSCLHIMKVDIQTSVNPIIGVGAQAQDMINYLESEYDENLDEIWQTNMFGKKLCDIAKDGLSQKMYAMPPEAQNKMRKTVCRIVNEGRGGVLCVLL